MSGRWLAAFSAAMVLAVIAAALLLVGSPRTARLERLDERRAADVEALVRWIETHRRLRSRLPDSLGALEPMLPGTVSALDPVTGAPYAYERLGDGHFRVCAELAIPDQEIAERQPRPRLPDSGRAIRPVIDPGGRRFCLETVDAPAPD